MLCSSSVMRKRTVAKIQVKPNDENGRRKVIVSKQMVFGSQVVFNASNK